MMHSLFDTAQEKPHPAPQKFHRLMVEGLAANGQQVTCLVALPVTQKTHPNKKWWKQREETIEGVHYVYIPFYNHPIPKLLGFRIFSFFYTLGWVLRTKGEKAMVCDVLNAHAFASMNACRLLGVQSVGIVTDIPGYMNFSNKKESWLKRISNQRSVRNIKRMTHLVPLTEAMCEIINPEKKIPYVVVEGLVDASMQLKEPKPFGDGVRHVTYTGTLHEVFGVKALVEGFMKLGQKDVVLDIYGRGPMKDEMEAYMTKDSRIRYHGVVSLEESVKAQCSSFLLVNPRPTKDEFTKYSFPSKNMEYMATGVPLLTTVLPGMPKEYYPYVFLLEDETVDGIANRINEILQMPEEIVRQHGRQAKSFVMEQKNNLIQAKKIVELIKQ